jgi:3-oxoacid CoA-transferase
MKKVPRISPAEAAGLVKDGDVLMAGGFGMTGNPVHLLHALAETSVKGLTYIGNNVGEPGLGGGRLLRTGQLSKAIGSFFTSNREAVAAERSKKLEVRLLPQGTLAEAIRAGGAGIGGFFTPTAQGTVLTKDSEVRKIQGTPHVFVEALRANVAFVRAWRADTAGNLVYRMTEQNFNRAMATAADVVVAEVEEIVPIGELDPNEIHTPGIYVDYLVEAHTTLEELGTSASVDAAGQKADAARLNIARRALAELRSGDVVNLGIGIPTLVADFIEPDSGILLHTENGMLGIGPAPNEGGALDYPVNAGKIPVTAVPGTSYFDSTDSFAMIRGRHVDVAVMGGLQVDTPGTSRTGRCRARRSSASVAQWILPPGPSGSSSR